jgi:hypothetical protein
VTGTPRRWATRFEDSTSSKPQSCLHGHSAPSRASSRHSGGKGAATKERRLSRTRFTTFAIIALVLAVVGLSAVKACAMTQRTRDIGVHMVLGAQPGRVIWLFLKRSRRATHDRIDDRSRGGARRRTRAPVLPLCRRAPMTPSRRSRPSCCSSSWRSPHVSDRHGAPRLDSITAIRHIDQRVRRVELSRRLAVEHCAETSGTSAPVIRCGRHRAKASQRALGRRRAKHRVLIHRAHRLTPKGPTMRDPGTRRRAKGPSYLRG